MVNYTAQKRALAGRLARSRVINETRVIDATFHSESVMTVEIPDALVFATRMTETDIRRELAIVLYQQEKLTLGAAALLASMPQAEFQALLGSRGVAPHYDERDFALDVEGLRRRGVV